MSHLVCTTPLWSCDDIQKATKGTVISPFSVNNVLIDSREIRGGELFVALKGPKFDGHDYVADALDKGASGALVDHVPDNLKGSPETFPLIVVEDVLQALNDLAKAARARSTAKIIGVTGSFGKTSLKEALRHVLEKQGATLATERSFNNHWGLPLTLARLHPEHTYAVIEMGMNNPGEISSHSKLVQPHIAVITNTGDAHIGKMGSVEEIARAKGEIFDGLVAGGTAVLWAQDKVFEDHKRKALSKKATVLSFGDAQQANGADFQATYELKAAGLDVSVSHAGEKKYATLPTFSAHWSRNCAAVSACLKALGLQWASPLSALKFLSFPKGRGNILRPYNTLTILDESYNAAPTTMEYALKSLINMGAMTERRIIAILGDMLELGKESPAYHRNLAKTSGFFHIAKVYCCGFEMENLYSVLPEMQKGGFAKEPRELINEILTKAMPGDIYLVKGSRGQWAERGRMSVFVDALFAHRF
ncbi:MAG: UDP-N-acetylmuramoyl-tripeptide--D-alanyl-D-alanine ligase [Alphaproteobacteria bacterium]|nr:UDP-N-acetylmuramoyl-tripeptide--D-alanyl-D-alanine ligase [Alphaproteobacteria bacterium]